MEQEPDDVIVLSAISQGAKKINKILKKTRIEENDLRKLIDRLQEKGFVMSVEKKGLFGPKKRDFAYRKRQQGVRRTEI